MMIKQKTYDDKMMLLLWIFIGYLAGQRLHGVKGFIIVAIGFLIDTAITNYIARRVNKYIDNKELFSTRNIYDK